jgi:hypothetical protein
MHVDKTRDKSSISTNDRPPPHISALRGRTDIMYFIPFDLINKNNGSSSKSLQVCKLHQSWPR